MVITYGKTLQLLMKACDSHVLIPFRIKNYIYFGTGIRGIEYKKNFENEIESHFFFKYPKYYTDKTLRMWL